MSTLLNSEEIRSQFPILAEKVYETQPFIYLDSAASSQTPLSVTQGMSEFYDHAYATVHRGLYSFSQLSTKRYDEVREHVAQFLGAARPEEIIFTKHCTEAINLVAHSFSEQFLKPGDELLISEIEHHANFVPWQHLAYTMGLHLKFIPATDSGELDMAAYRSLLSDKTALVAVQHVSNVLGSIHPIKEMIDLAHAVGAKVLIDGAQGVPHLPVNVCDLDCDFYCFSAHKLYGPTGLGVLYGKYDLLDQMPPYMLGGDMVNTVTKEQTTYAPLPLKFEAGTPPFVEVIGLGLALSFVESIGFDAIYAHDQDLLTYATQQMKAIDGCRLIGEAKHKIGVISFLIGDIHPHDIGTILDVEGLAIRAGHHCSQPTMQRYGVSATARASFGVYNTRSDVDAFIAGLHKVIKVMQ